MASTPEPLILASASTTRANLLRAAGVAFAIDPADIDEEKIKREHRMATRDAAACALALAEAKAFTVAASHPGALVIGADQILVVGDRWFDKPPNLEKVASQLRELRGRAHVLITAACVYRGGSRLWHAVTKPRLAMRCFGEAFLATYIAAEGDAVLGSVGAYRIEGSGVQLFEFIEGDHFSILGLPLLELLRFLRGRGVLGE
jgi:septum formation protein